MGEAVKWPHAEGRERVPRLNIFHHITSASVAGRADATRAEPLSILCECAAHVVRYTLGSPDEECSETDAAIHEMFFTSFLVQFGFLVQ